MGWAAGYIEQLKKGETIAFRPTGNSMRGKISSGQLVTVTPVKDRSEISSGDVVLCKIGTREYLHLVKTIRQEQGKFRYQIGNNKGGINGWVGFDGIFGRVVQVES